MCETHTEVNAEAGLAVSRRVHELSLSAVSKQVCESLSRLESCPSEIFISITSRGSPPPKLTPSKIPGFAITMVGNGCPAVFN